MEQRLNFVTFVVADLEASRRFYVDGLGWEPAVDVPGDVLMFRVADKVLFALWAQEHAEAEIGPVTRAGTPPFTVAHNCASPADVDRVLGDARAAGAAVSGPEQRDWGGYTGYFKDPDGFHWEVAHAPDGVGGITFP
jgi:catechol 2,3-dioxygenase-like lactoylglutathione lyase family enzyme